VSFIGTGSENTYGGFLDNVNLSCGEPGDDDTGDDDSGDDDSGDDDSGDDDSGDDDSGDDDSGSDDSGDTTGGDDGGTGADPDMSPDPTPEDTGPSTQTSATPGTGLQIQGSGWNCALNVSSQAKSANPMTWFFLGLFMLPLGLRMRRQNNKVVS